MTIKLGVVMDAIASINYKKDSTLAMLWEANARGWEIYYVEQKDLFLRDGIAYADAKILKVYKDPDNWFSVSNSKIMPLTDLNVILMRKDPPFDQEYVYTTHLLEYAERNGVLVVNRPQALRDFNEKLFASYFPQCSPPTLVTREIEKLTAFWQEQKDIVCKPLDSMGGASVFRLQKEDVNTRVIFETLTHGQTRYTIAQKFVSDIVHGDKRILLIDGEPVHHALARVPQGQDWRGNLAVGAKGVVQSLTERDKWICAQLQPILHANGLLFVGIDVIGDYLTEINITSPTGIRELDQALNANISAELLDVIEKRLKK